jgi:hypothetical protein
LIKIVDWEFWSTWLVYLPVLVCYPYWAARCHSIFFFAFANPKIPMGGLYGSSKYESLKHINASDKPATMLVKHGERADSVLSKMSLLNINFPIILKPDFGERGKGVELVRSEKQLRKTIPTHSSDFVIQEYLDMPFEAGVFYIKKPWEEKGKVTSIVVKGFLHVVGDGVQTIEELALKNKRAVLLWDKLSRTLKGDLSTILPIGELVTLEPIGNHSRGTAFNNGNHLINAHINAWAERIADHLPEFYYGRFDIRAPSAEDFSKGHSIKIMEVNGANAEPAHIYQEGASLFSGLATLVKYWHTIHLIARFNKKNMPSVKFKDALFFYRRWQKIKREKWNDAVD